MNTGSIKRSVQLTAINGDNQLLERLLKQGAPVDPISEADGSTPLHDAAWLDRAETCRVLINHKASIDPRNLYGRTPLEMAIRGGYKNVCQLLIEHNASLDASMIKHSHHQNISELIIGIISKRIKANQSVVIALLGIKKFCTSPCLILIDKHIMQSIARQIHESAKQEKQNLFSAIMIKSKGSYEARGLEAYAHEQLKITSKTSNVFLDIDL
jgi:ankyrin repeat protein